MVFTKDTAVGGRGFDFTVMGINELGGVDSGAVFVDAEDDLAVGVTAGETEHEVPIDDETFCWTIKGRLKGLEICTYIYSLHPYSFLSLF